MDFGKDLFPSRAITGYRLMLRLNPRNIWLNPAATLGPKQHWIPSEELCWAWLTAEHSLLVLPVIHTRLILGLIPAHTEISNTRSVLCTACVWIVVLICSALIPTVPSQCLAGGQSTTPHLQGLCSALCSWTCCWHPQSEVPSILSWMYKTTLFPSAIQRLYGLFLKCLVT